MRLRSAVVCVLGPLALFSAGCSGTPGVSPLSLPDPAPAETQAAAPAPEAGSSFVPQLPSLSLHKSPVGSPTEIYTRVARGVLTCWFGAAGPLKGRYIYHAEADPPSKGGASQIAIHTKDKDAADPRSIRAYRVAIAQGAERTNVETENFKLDEKLAERLSADVARWAAEENEGCAAEPATGGWGAQPASPQAESKYGKDKTAHQRSSRPSNPGSTGKSK